MGTDRRLPDGAFSTAGHRSQHAVMVPSKYLVVVRKVPDPMIGSGWNQAVFVAGTIGAIRDYLWGFGVRRRCSVAPSSFGSDAAVAIR